MNFEAEIHAAALNPQKLEQLYQDAQQHGQTEAFQTAVLACYKIAPDNLLYAAWFFRFHQSVENSVTKQRGMTNWLLAIPLSILTGLIFWALSDFEHLLIAEQLPLLFLWWSPIATTSTLIYLAGTAGKSQRRAVFLGAGLLVIATFISILTPMLSPAWKVEQYSLLAVIHMPLLCWVALGMWVLGFHSSTEDRFAFLIKSIEVMVTAGLYLIAGIAFGAITVGMFAALSLKLPDIWLRLIAAGGFGLLPVLAVATVYDPHIPPFAQNFTQGLSKFISTMMRLLLPLTLGVLVIYLFVIPFNFMAPFHNRDVLIVYNLMLFAILGLLLGATPMQRETLSTRLQQWLRAAMMTVAFLVVVVSLYALSATVVRTANGGLTLNRLTIIGWNSINIGILCWLIVKQFIDKQKIWITSLQSVFSLATNAYLAWACFVLIAFPFFFLFL